MDYASAFVTPKRRPSARAMLILRVNDTKRAAQVLQAAGRADSDEAGDTEYISGPFAMLHRDLNLERGGGY
jgi:hypothetical protein